MDLQLQQDMQHGSAASTRHAVWVGSFNEACSMGRQLRQGMQLELAGHVQCHQALRTFHVLLFALFDSSDLEKYCISYY